MNLRPLVIAALLAASASSPALAADTTKTLGKFGDWSSFSYAEGHAKVCYLATTADKVTGGEKGKHAAIYLIVTHRPNNKGVDEVSVTAGNSFKKDSKVELQVGAMKHALFTKGDHAWADDSKADKAIIASLKKGREAILHASPAKGHDIAGAFPLSGFSDALAAADKACGVKR
jgi:invasion protein IalB